MMATEPITELLPGIYRFGTRSTDGSAGIIASERGIVAIDVGNEPDEGEAMVRFIRSLGGTPDRVILTHGHNDHVLGGAAFDGAEVYANAKTPDEIRRQLQGYATRRGVDYDHLLTQALFPTVTFTDELRIDLGNRQLWLFPTPGHSRDHVSVYVEPERVLFAADTVVTGIVPAIGDGDSRVLEATVRKLLTLDISLLVAGHGPPLVGAEAIRAWIQWEIDYLSGMRAAIEAAASRGDAIHREALATIVPYSQWVGDRLPADQHNMTKRHLDTASKIAAEIQAQSQVAQS